MLILHAKFNLTGYMAPLKRPRNIDFMSIFTI